MAKDEFVRIGLIPVGTPIDLIANADLDLSNQGVALERVKLIAMAQENLLKIKQNELDSAAAQQIFSNMVPGLMKISKCPDFVLDHGHYFGTTLSDNDKRALIEFMKTF
jgi:hypothetical protein